MPRKVYALLVGIDAYQEPVRALEGCRNDMRHLGEYLTVRLGDAVELVTLVDDDATRDAVIDAFRNHLGRATTGDIAIFAYSGHGSQEMPPTALATSESSGRLQNLILQDAGRTIDGVFRWPLADKELRVLLEAVAAGGPHTVAILDCCHSGDATRDVTGALRQWLPEEAMSDDRETRAMIDALKGPRPDDAFVDGALTLRPQDEELRHVALYACQSKQTAKEDVFSGEHRGVFSASLLDVLATVNSAATYRDVLAAVRDRVQRDFPSQRPDLFPERIGGAGDARFLDGTVQAGPASFSMTRSGTGWVVDGGSMHGLGDPVDGSEYRLTCSSPDGTRRGEVRVVSVRAADARVEPIDWVPDEPVYRAVIVKAPRPLAAVTFVPVDSGDATTAYQHVRDRLTTSGPGGTPSLYVREAITGGPAAGLALRLRFDASAGPGLRIERADGTPAIPPPVSIVSTADLDAAAETIVGQLEHLAQWERIRELGTHRSALADEVSIEVFPGNGPDEDGIPTDRAALAFTGEYTLDGPAGRPIYFWVRVSKRSDRSDLYLALLDLDDKLSCQPLRQSTAFINNTWDQQFSFTAPSDGTVARDWFKFVVSEFDFRADSFSLPPVADAVAVRRPPPDDLVDAPAESERGASVVGPPPGPDSCAITIPFTVRATAREGTG